MINHEDAVLSNDPAHQEAGESIFSSPPEKKDKPKPPPHQYPGDAEDARPSEPDNQTPRSYVESAWRNKETRREVIEYLWVQYDRHLEHFVASYLKREGDTRVDECMTDLRAVFFPLDSAIYNAPDFWLNKWDRNRYLRKYLRTLVCYFIMSWRKRPQHVPLGDDSSITDSESPLNGHEPLVEENTPLSILEAEEQRRLRRYFRLAGLWRYRTECLKKTPFVGRCTVATRSRTQDPP